MSSDPDSLIEQLRGENAALRFQLDGALGRISELESTNRRLQERIAQLERENARQAAPFRREPAKKVPPDEKTRPGRKPGHPGAYRRVPEQIDEEIEVPLSCCPDCGGPLQDVFPVTQFTQEIPPVRPHNTRLVTWPLEFPFSSMQRGQ